MVARLLGMGGGLEDGTLVFLEHFQPMVEVGGVVLPRRRRDAKVAAEEGGTDLGDQLLAGVAGVAPLPAAEIPVEAGRVLGPVGQFVGQRRTVSFGVAEGDEGRHLHVIRLLGVIGRVPAVADVGPRVGEEAVGMLDPLHRVERGAATA